MSAMRYIVATSIMCGIVSASYAANDDGITLGYVTGNKYNTLSEDNRTAWIVGVMDGLMAEDLLSNKNPRGPWLGRCIKGLPIAQVREIFEKKLRTEPDSWHAPSALAFRDTMERFCKNRI